MDLFEIFLAFTLLHLDSQEFKGEVVFSLNKVAEHLNNVFTLFTHIQHLDFEIDFHLELELSKWNFPAE